VKTANLNEIIIKFEFNMFSDKIEKAKSEMVRTYERLDKLKTKKE